MEAKKSPRADLENKKGLYLEIGLIVILAASLLAFNLKSYDVEQNEGFQREAITEIEEQIIQTQTETPPPPPEQQPEVVVTNLNIVDDDVQVEDIHVNADDDADKAQEAFVPIEVPQEETVVEEEIFTVVENEPEFPGGMEALYKYFGENIKYPQVAKDNNITGKVYVTFVVEKDGSIANPKVLRDIGGGCGQEAIRVVKAMPKWKPGKQRGKAVRVQFNLPVSFNLQ